MAAGVQSSAQSRNRPIVRTRDDRTRLLRAIRVGGGLAHPWAWAGSLRADVVRFALGVSLGPTRNVQLLEWSEHVGIQVRKRGTHMAARKVLHARRHRSTPSACVRLNGVRFRQFLAPKRYPVYLRMLTGRQEAAPSHHSRLWGRHRTIMPAGLIALGGRRLAIFQPRSDQTFILCGVGTPHVCQVSPGALRSGSAVPYLCCQHNGGVC